MHKTKGKDKLRRLVKVESEIQLCVPGSQEQKEPQLRVLGATFWYLLLQNKLSENMLP